ncbi:hypothetical protein HMPREF3145_08290 [Corynebacterium sp. HMSC05C01]|uniref:hypothetical protein n=1 Tax=Corynebacterium sp. HMSC05C01 TaxID=1581113 RepID=UPI0008A36BA3|nr:hypothetical protein [Corynebacterium sp. HMSC05C01]OFT68874.1 hypothetical protein HMPREF3145_08290 [Corynebacterium sp. HMSC05C01]
MTRHVSAVDVDVDNVRTQYGAAINAYRAAAHDLDTRRITVDPSAFGDGFAEQGRRVAEALEALHSTSKRFLEVRSENWEQVLALTDDIVAADALAAEALEGVEQP